MPAPVPPPDSDPTPSSTAKQRYINHLRVRPDQFTALQRTKRVRQFASLNDAVRYVLDQYYQLQPKDTGDPT